LSFNVTADAPFAGTLALEGETVTSYRVAVSPAHGTVTINEDGTFVYYPDEGFTGTDSFAYAVSEQLEFSEPCIVEITVE
jgi:VCBS repeat-containing protein